MTKIDKTYKDVSGYYIAIRLRFDYDEKNEHVHFSSRRRREATLGE